jgi:hypothetical protein|tara:strand:- start:656 stop:862 length:207 start_codon:yes stop_codon:yes gene_type:complete
MDSTIGFSIAIGSAIVVGVCFFWCTYRHQVEPVEGRKTEDQLNAMYAAKLRQEIEMAHQESSEEKDDI